MTNTSWHLISTQIKKKNRDAMNSNNRECESRLVTTPVDFYYLFIYLFLIKLHFIITTIWNQNVFHNLIKVKKLGIMTVWLLFQTRWSRACSVICSPLSLQRMWPMQDSGSCAFGTRLCPTGAGQFLQGARVFPTCSQNSTEHSGSIVGATG